jgi:hypothetical protein
LKGRISVPRIIHRTSDHQIPDALEQVDTLDTVKWTGDIADDLLDSLPVPNILQELGHRTEWEDEELKKALRAIVLKLQAI